MVKKKIITFIFYAGVPCRQCERTLFERKKKKGSMYFFFFHFSAGISFINFAKLAEIFMYWPK